ncbi:tyrosine-type recombinase/integrase [Acinetobacter baumannii]|uniref:tyrosine-type recombinase/integrase n=1 Tax=Acinetobacter baumannii TaxID=470 RepID=UPI0009A2A57C|nr:integrase family protein [Acinetobacter baumannii]
MAQHIKFTKSVIDSIPLSEEKQIFYRDTVTIGFGLCVGKTKSYFAEKKMPNGKSKRKVIGKHGVYTLEQARTEAKRLLIMMDEGVDPVKQKRDIRASAIQNDALQKLVPTLSEAYQYYKLRKKLAETSLIAYDGCIENYFNDWKDIKLDQITSAMIIDRHLKLSEASPSRANLASKFLHALFNHTISRYKDESGNKILNIKNPVVIVKEEKAFNKIKRRKGHVRADQREAWALAVATTYWMGEQNNDFRAYTNQDFLFLLALTGFRRSEAEAVEWKNVDLQFGTIKIVNTKNHEDLLLPMGDTLWHIMRERKKRAGDNKYVFTDRNGVSHISDRRAAREKVTENSGIEFTFHDLRRTFGTIANSLAIGSYTIKRLINHITEDDDHDVTDGYIQVSFEDLKKAMNMIEDVIISEPVKVLIKSRLYFEKNESRNQAQELIDHHTQVLDNFKIKTQGI